jgi:hypothetical protein
MVPIELIGVLWKIHEDLNFRYTQREFHSYLPPWKSEGLEGRPLTPDSFPETRGKVFKGTAGSGSDPSVSELKCLRSPQNPVIGVLGKFDISR